MTKRTIEIQITLPDSLCDPIPAGEDGMDNEAWLDAEHALMEHFGFPIPRHLTGRMEARSILAILLMVRFIPAFRSARRESRRHSPPAPMEELSLVEAVEAEQRRGGGTVVETCQRLISRDARIKEPARKVIPERWQHLTAADSLRKRYNNAKATVRRLTMARLLSETGGPPTALPPQTRTDRAATALRSPSKRRVH